SARFGDFIVESTPSLFYNLFVVKMCAPLSPTITAQPHSLSVDVGTTATFSVTAAHSVPLTYQWRKNGVNIPGAANENLLITNVQALDAAAYDVVVSSDGGSISSTLATLTVVSPYAGTFMFGATAYSV